MTDDIVVELERWADDMRHHDADMLLRARDEIVALRRALEESVKLQRHYALQLNDYDGGKRIPFETAEAWMERLRALEDKRHD